MRLANLSRLKATGRGADFALLAFIPSDTFKSLLINAGVAVETADVLTGHAKKSVSETYIHRSVGLLTDAVAKLPDFAVK